MGHRRTLTAITLTVLVAILAVGAWFGWQNLIAPLPPEETANGNAPACADGVRRGDVVRVRDLTVSVYNAGDVTGLAGRTLDELAARGFKRGAAGNAPDSLTDVLVVRVLTQRTRRDPVARLVALQFGPNTVIQRVRRDLGPGVEVVVGNGFVGLSEAPRRLRADRAGSAC
jgi:hypothetical protein